MLCCPARLPVSASSRFPGGTARSVSRRAWSRYRSFRRAVDWISKGSRDRSPRQTRSVSSSRSDRITGEYNAWRYSVSRGSDPVSSNIPGAGLDRPTCPDTVGQLAQARLGRVPADAGGGARLAQVQPLGVDQLLPAVDQEALEHHPDDAALAGLELGAHVLQHERLVAVVLVRVAVAGVDHHPLGQVRLAELVEHLGDG